MIQIFIISTIILWLYYCIFYLFYFSDSLVDQHVTYSTYDTSTVTALPPPDDIIKQVIKPENHLSDYITMDACTQTDGTESKF